MRTDTLSQVQGWLAKTGFVEDLAVVDGALVARPSGRRFDPTTDVVVVDTHRFEGQSDPDDEAILFAIATADGAPLGTLTLPYGAAASPEEEDVIAALHEAPPSAAELRSHCEHDHAAAIFPDREAAERAVDDLRRLGFGSEHLGVAVHGTDLAAFEHDQEVDMESDAAVGAAVGIPVGFIAGLTVAALVVPGIGVLGVGGLLGVGVASAIGGAMLGGYLGIAAASEERDEHEALEHLPLRPGEVIVAVCSHGRRGDVEAAFERHGGRVIARGLPAIGG